MNTWLCLTKSLHRLQLIQNSLVHAVVKAPNPVICLYSNLSIGSGSLKVTYFRPVIDQWVFMEFLLWLKVRMRIPIGMLTLGYAYVRFRVILPYWSIYRFWQMPLFNSIVPGDSLNSQLWNVCGVAPAYLSYISIVHKLYTPWVKSEPPYNHGYKCVNFRWICKTLSLLQK